MWTGLKKESGTQKFYYSRILKLSKVNTDPFVGALETSVSCVSLPVLGLCCDFLPVDKRRILS